MHRARLALSVLLMPPAFAGCGADHRSPAAGGAAARPPVTDVAAPTRLPSGRPPVATYAPWPAAGHDPRHTGAAPVVGPQHGTVRWKRTLEGAVVPGPVVGADGTVYAASNGGVLHALDPATGHDRWRLDGGAPYGSDLTTSPLLLPGARTLLWPGPRNALIAVDARSGERRWRLDLGAQGLSPALGPDGTAYVADAGGGLRAVEVTGPRPRVRWRTDLGGGSYAAAAVDRRGGVTTVYGAAGNDLVAVRDEGTRGPVAWRGRTNDLVEVSPSVASDGTVVVGSNDKRLHAFAPDGAPRWTAPLQSLTYSSSAAAPDGTVLVGDHRGAVSRIRVRDGRLIARYVGLAQTPRRRSVGVWTAPATDVRGDVYFGTRTGHVYGFAYGGRRLFALKTGATVDSNPALGPDGTLYVGSEDGRLYAIADAARTGAS